MPTHPSREALRILFLTTGCFDKGGISRYCRYQIEALRELNGNGQVYVLSLLGPDGTGFETPFSVDWHGKRGGPIDKIRFSGAAIRAAISVRPDVVHAAHVNLAPLAVKIAKLCRAKTLLNVYGLEVWSGLSGARRRALRAVDQVVADCHFTSAYVRSEGLHRSSPDVIWDCVDLDRFTPGECSPHVRRKYSLPDKKVSFVVLSLGRLDQRAAHKGFDRLIKALTLTRAQSKDIRLVIAGKGDDRPRLEALASRNGIGNIVSFSGSIEEQDLADVYRSASVFSLVSDCGHGRGEGIPLTPLEAMACGVPIIVGNQDGSTEAVVEDANGFVIDPFDLKAHAEVILRIASAPGVAEQLGIRARLVAVDSFGYGRFVDQHRELYELILSGDTRVGPRDRLSSPIDVPVT